MEIIKLLQKRAERADNFINVFTKSILSTLEAERVRNGLRAPEMARLLGISCSRYSGMIHDHRLPSQQVLLRFFYIFGFDFESSLALEKVRDNRNNLCEEIGNLVAGLSDDQLNAIIKTIENSPSEDHAKYNYSFLLCSALRNFMSNRDQYGKEIEKLDDLFSMSDEEIKSAEEYCSAPAENQEFDMPEDE